MELFNYITIEFKLQATIWVFIPFSSPVHFDHVLRRILSYSLVTSPCESDGRIRRRCGGGNTVNKVYMLDARDDLMVYLIVHSC